MESINLKSLNLTIEESKDIINYIAQKRGISTKKLLSTIKPNLKRKNHKILTAKTQQKLTKTQQKLSETQKNLIKTQKNLIKTKTQQKRKNTQILTYEEPSKLAKSENLTSQKQQILSKTKNRIEAIREKLKELRHKLSRSELKEIRKHLYNIENKNELLEYETTKEYLDELDEKILESDDDDFEFIGIENVQELFKILIYKPTIVKSGYNNSYIEYRSEGDKLLTVEEYLALIEPYLRELINDHKSKGEWKIQLTAQINFISLRPGSDKTRVMHTRSNNEEFMNGSDTDEIIKELFKSILQRNQENLQEKMRGSDFTFDGVNFLYYDFNKISISRGGSYIDSPKWLKNKKSIINPKNNDYKCFQYAVTLALNLDKINKNSQRISKIKPFIEEYNWKDIDFPSTSKDWKKFELNNEVALNILYVPHNTKKIEIAYKSKHNLTREKRVILLMISNGENWHYLTVKNLSR